MRKYKDSGSSWVGRIPIDWKMLRGKNLFVQKSDKGNSKALVLLSPTQNYGVIPQDLYEELSGFTAVKLNENIDYNLLKTVHKGAYVISLRSFQGGFEYSEYEGVVSPAYQVFYPIAQICDRYYKYLFKDKSFVGKMNSYTMSLRDGKTIAFDDFSRTYIPFPPVEEQERIAFYLDAKCAEVDDLSVNIQCEIDTLEAYKRSVITETVTKGVEKDIPLKDSGMAWCKRIPVRWEVIPSKYLFANSDLRRLDGDEQLTASQRHGIITQTEYMERENAKIVFANQGLENWKHVSPNDFIISLRSFQGGLELSEVSGCITWHYVVLKAKKPVFHRYYKWLFKSSVYITALQRTCNFIRDGQDLRYSNFAQVPLPLPPIAEQKKIADYLDGKCRDIDEIIAHKRKQLAVLADYKKSVIYEYVTGKKEAPVI